MSKRFAANNLALNLDKRNIITFKTNNVRHYELNIGYNYKYIEEIAQTKFLGIQIDSI
jgi:hypothetical protein